MILPILALLIQQKTFAHIFDDYYAYQKGNAQTFAYDAKRVCKIYNYHPHNYARLENVFDQFDRTAAKRLNIDTNIIACLNYKGYSYLFTATNSSSTTVVRGASTRILSLAPNMLCHDHLHSLLYLIAEDTFLYRIRLEILHHDFRNTDIETLIHPVKLSHSLPLNNITDTFVFNHTLYWLTSDGKVYKQDITGKNDTIALVEENYPDIKFSVIPFPVDGAQPVITVTNPHIKISGLGGDTIFLPLPSSSLNDSTNNNIVLYILDIIFFFCLIVILRIATRKSAGKEKAYVLELFPTKVDESN